VITERMSCGSVIIVKSSVLGTMQISAATWVLGYSYVKRKRILRREREHFMPDDSRRCWRPVEDVATDPITALSVRDKGADRLHGPGPSYRNEDCIVLAGVVNENNSLGVVLHDEGSKVRKEPEAYSQL
jgi:hypothetical protein